MGPYPFLSLRFSVDLGVLANKGYSTFPNNYKTWAHPADVA